jgi:N-acylneuraminate cytidylyltransferase
MGAIAVIPARGGSRRIPRKNIRVFRGKPILAWSIEAAIASGCFERVVVSTDDDEIGAVAREFGAEVPFRRPAELSDDFAGTDAVLRHALDEMRRLGASPAHACCLYATAPFVTGELIRSGLRTLESSRAHSAFTVTRFEFPIRRALRIDAEGRLAMIWPEHRKTRSQDLEPAYHDAGQLYWVVVDRFLETGDILHPPAAPILVPRHRVQDIDDLDDWRRAELMHAALEATE